MRRKSSSASTTSHHSVASDRQPVRTVSRIEVRKQGQLITIVVVGDAFLRGMVRRMAAALIRVGKGKANVEDVRRALAAKSPAFKGEAAPARGLTLWDVPMGPDRDRTQQRARTKRQD